MEQTPNFQTDVKKWSDNPLVKVVIIGFIILVLMIPSVMISNLVHERSYRKNAVVAEVSSKWGQMQTIAGPYISIPYYTEIKKKDAASEWREGTLNYFPKTLDIQGHLDPVIRKRSIFKVMLYESDLVLKSHFEYPDLASLYITPDQVAWEKATIHLGINDLSGIGSAVNCKIVDTILPMSAATPLAIRFNNGLMSSLPLRLAKSTGFDVEIPLSLKGSLGMYFTPVANNTTVTISSSWPSPKFEGQFLPDTSEISKDGFKATWTVLDINRHISQQWTDLTTQEFSAVTANPSTTFDNRYAADGSNAVRSVLGVELFDTVDHYTKNDRTVKYSFLLITLTFVIYFFCEVLKKQKVHPLQYGLVGAALVIFFILLLSLSEHIGFDAAYFVSSLATITLITLYSRSIFTEKKYALVAGGLLAIQFGFIYTILQLEDFALLAGSMALFATIALIMYLTRKVKWQ